MADISAQSRAFLDAWYSQKPTFALMGEFSAGKSTLLNLLLGSDLLPTQVTATNMPVIWMTHADQQSAHGLGNDGVLHECDMATFAQQGQQDYLLIRLAMPIDILKRIDVIDTPGISDPRLALDTLKFLGPYLDFVMWCTAANQAWRQTENAMWTSMPTSLRANSILALTRADILKKTVDLNKVIRRCTREADELFRDFVPVAALVALAARSDDGKITDPKMWDQSHAEELFASLDQSIDFAVNACTGREKLACPDTQTTKASTSEKATKSRQNKAPKQPVKTTAATAQQIKKTLPKITENLEKSNTYKLLSAISALRYPKTETSSNEQFFNTLDHLFNTFLSETKLSEAHQMVLRQMVSLERHDDVSQEGVIVQLERELEDFTDDPWCKLDQVH